MSDENDPLPELSKILGPLFYGCITNDITELMSKANELQKVAVLPPAEMIQAYRGAGWTREDPDWSQMHFVASAVFSTAEADKAQKIYLIPIGVLDWFALAITEDTGSAVKQLKARELLEHLKAWDGMGAEHG